MRLTKSASKESYVKAVEGRIQALAQAHTLLSESRWQGADVKRLAMEEIAPYRGVDPARVQVVGRRFRLRLNVPKASRLFCMSSQPIRRNTVRYPCRKALSRSIGR